MSGHWTNTYVGIPWRDLGRDRLGVDCWGLVRLVYAEQLRLLLPSYVGAYTSVEEHAELSAHIEGVTRSGIWTAIDTADAQPFDVLVFRRGRLDTHVGLVVEPGLMLHVAAREQAKIEGYAQGRWKHRLNGLYRHLETASKDASQ